MHDAELHDLMIDVRNPGLTARTTTRYFDEPFYDDAANPEIQRETVTELEWIAQLAHGESDGEVARQHSKLELTERLSEAKLTSFTKELHGKKTQQAPEALSEPAGGMECRLQHLGTICDDFDSVYVWGLSMFRGESRMLSGSVGSVTPTVDATLEWKGFWWRVVTGECDRRA